MIIFDHFDHSILGEFEEMMKELHADFEKSNGRPGIPMPGLPLRDLPLFLSPIGV
jgi:hypothetical protein